MTIGEMLKNIEPYAAPLTPEAICEVLEHAIGEVKKASAKCWVEFGGNKYILVARDLDHSGPLATEEQYVNGELPFAHYYCNPGIISQFGSIIGTREDITTLGECHVSPSAEAIARFL